MVPYFQTYPYARGSMTRQATQAVVPKPFVAQVRQTASCPWPKKDKNCPGIFPIFSHVFTFSKYMCFTFFPNALSKYILSHSLSQIVKKMFKKMWKNAFWKCVLKKCVKKKKKKKKVKKMWKNVNQMHSEPHFFEDLIFEVHWCSFHWRCPKQGIFGFSISIQTLLLL